MLAAAAVLVRLGGLFHMDLSFAVRPDDSLEYRQLAQGMLHGCGFARMIDGVCQPSEILRTPGYPLLLTLMPDIRWVIVGQALMAGVLCLLLAARVGRRWGFAAAMVTEAIVAFGIPSIVMANEVMSEASFQLLVVLAVVPGLLMIARPRRPYAVAIGSGIAAAFAILIRPIGILFPFICPIPFLAAPSLRWRRRIALAAIAGGIPALTLAGWVMRNYEGTGFAGLSTVGEINLYYYRAANLAARERGVRLEAMRAPFGRRLGVPYQQIYKARVQSPALAARMERLALSYLERRPFATLAMTLQSALYLALTPMRSPLARLLGIAGASSGGGLNAGAPSLARLATVERKLVQSPVLATLVVVQMLTTLAVWAGVGLALKRCFSAGAEYRFWTLYLTGVAAMLLLLAAGGEADARFRVPAKPLLAIVAVLGYFGEGAGNRRPGAEHRFIARPLRSRQGPLALEAIGRSAGAIIH